jgi:glycosyltransferase involved in cell wall biosynthesis
MRVQVVDPSAYSRPYDHALCTALAHEGLEVELVTSAFAYGEVPPPDGYAVRELFYGRALGAAGSRLRTAAKLAQHLPDMRRYRRIAREADVVHFQWLPVQWIDRHLLPDRPIVLTAHDLLPREARPAQVRAQRRLYSAVDAIIAHSEYGRRQLTEVLGVDRGKVSVVRHGAFDHLTHLASERPLPAELAGVEGPVVLFFGLLRPYKGLEVLLDAWRGIENAELWIVGRPRIAVEPLQARAGRNVRFVPRFVQDCELPAYFRRADIVVLPYAGTERFDFSGVMATALAFGRPIVASEIGGFSELAEAGGAELVPPGDPSALHGALAGLLADRDRRERLAATARAIAEGSYSWREAARRTIEVYRRVERDAARERHDRPT